MGSIRDFIKEAKNRQPVDENTGAKLRQWAENSTLQKVAALKYAQELAEAMADSEEAEEAPMPDEEEVDEDTLAQALSEIIDEAQTLPEGEQNEILQAADTVEDIESASGQKAASVMDYVALLNYLGV